MRAVEGRMSNVERQQPHAGTQGRTFTPAYDDLLQEMGLRTAVIYGRVWRYGQGPEGLCYAPVRRLAEQLGMGVSSVYRGLRRLVEAGYLEDLTPGLRNVPHRYRTTQKKGVRPGTTQADKVFPAGTLNAESVPPGNRVFQAGTVQPKSVPQATMKIQDIKHTTKKEITAAQAPGLALFREVAGFLPPRQIHEDVLEAIRKMGTRLGRDVTADDLKPYLKAWAARGWRLTNLAWLYDWAVRGEIPTKGTAHGNDRTPTEPARAEPEQLSPEEFDRLVEYYNGPGRAFVSGV